MSIEESLDRLATNAALIAGAISTLAEAVNGTYKGETPIYGRGEAPAAADMPAPAAEGKKTRGRPPKVEAAVEEKPAAGFLDDDDEEEETAAPVLTRDDVKKSLMAAQERLTAKYADAQKGLNEAMAVLKDNGNVERIGQLGDDQKVFKKIIDAANAKAPKK